jgi:hypothetical protein
MCGSAYQHYQRMNEIRHVGMDQIAAAVRAELLISSFEIDKVPGIVCVEETVQHLQVTM